MPEGYSDKAKKRAADAIVSSGIIVRPHSGDPGNAGTANALTNAGGYMQLAIALAALTVSAAGVVSLDAETFFTNPTGQWSAKPTWASVWRQGAQPEHICNIDITDLDRPDQNNRVSIPAGTILTPMP